MNKKGALFIVLFFFLAAFAYVARGQTFSPSAILTWRAATFSPAKYQGKNLPTAGAQINLSVEVINKGVLLNLAKQNILWYLGDELIASGEGVREAIFRPTRDGLQDVRVEVWSQFGKVSAGTKIPVVWPEAVVSAPFPGGNFSKTNLTVRGYPYFFNVANLADLNFVWKVNSKEVGAAGDVDVLNLNVDPKAAQGFRLNVGLSITKKAGDKQGSSKEVILTYKKI
ncbi:MAG: hypothetical protein G01um101420_9 [Parcubacteria group bacterium Gr01-1014_20]|nr:MAG: hypothetical protein G01um101420_9 [Parcubacteria group bacterium Gr01-1014_20]